MRCDEFEQRLNRLLDQRRPPQYDAILNSHATICATCHGKLRTQLDILDALRSPQTDSDIAAKDVVYRVVVYARRKRRWRAIGAAGIAATTAIVCLLVLRWDPSDEFRKFAVSSEKDGVAGVELTKQATRHSSVELMASSAKKSNVDRNSDSPVGQTSRIAKTDSTVLASLPNGSAAPHVVSWPEFAELLPLESSVSLAAVPWIDDVAGSLRPLTASMRSALNVIRKTISTRRQTSNEPSADVPQTSCLSESSVLA